MKAPRDMSAAQATLAKVIRASADEAGETVSALAAE